MADMVATSLTSNVCKLMEGMTLERIDWQLETNEKIEPMKTGFRARLSTQDRILLLHNHVIHLPSGCDRRIGVATDVRKAFDSIPHEAFLKSRCRCGIKGKGLAFIESFLTDRHYRVKVRQTLGPRTANRYGVPHGSVLSPTLFNMVIGRQEETIQNGLDTGNDILK